MYVFGKIFLCSAGGMGGGRYIINYVLIKHLTELHVPYFKIGFEK